MADPDDYSEFEQGPMTSAAGEAMGGMSVPPEYLEAGIPDDIEFEDIDEDDPEFSVGNVVDPADHIDLESDDPYKIYSAGGGHPLMGHVREGKHKRLVQKLIQEEIEIYVDELMMETTMPYPGGLPSIPGVDFKMLCAAKGQILGLVGELMDTDVADQVMEELAKLMGLTGFAKMGFMAMAPDIAANIITNGFKMAGC